MMAAKNILLVLLAATIASDPVLAEAPMAVTHQRPEKAIPALRSMSYHTIKGNESLSSILPRTKDLPPAAVGNIFGKRQREEDPETGALLCKKAPCPDDR